MNCEICGQDGLTLVIIPKKKADSLIMLVCPWCALKEGMYCGRHNMPHVGFADGPATACIRCINERVDREAPQAAGYRDELQQFLPASQWKVIAEAAEIVRFYLGEPVEMTILRFIITRAEREHKETQDVIDDALQAASAQSIVPHMYGS